MRTGLYLLLAMLFAGLAWVAWYPPCPTFPHVLRIATPREAGKENTTWQVVTRRLISKAAIQDMERRLRMAGLHPVKIIRHEVIVLHAFDDKRTFATKRLAIRAKNEWLRHGLEADVIEKDGYFVVALGRFTMAGHASQLQARLKKTGLPFTYERRRIGLPVCRFIFPPLPESEARQLWKKVADLGLAEPVLIPEHQFETLFGKGPQQQ